MWGRDHPMVVDVLIAAGVMLFGIAAGFTGQQDPKLHDPNAISIALSVIGTAPLVVRRRWPLTVFGVCWATTMVHSYLQYSEPAPVFGTLFALYAVAAHARTRRSAVVALVVAMSSTAVFFFIPQLGTGLGDVLGIWATLVASWVLGDNMRIRRAYVSAVEERAERLEQERDAEAQRAVLEERTRIARELHDVVAHGMSVMVVQAGAARRTLAKHDAERATEALRNIESTGRGALEEMRRLVGVLRASAASARDGAYAVPRLPQPGIRDLDDLVRHCCEAGLDVTLQVEGDLRPLPSGLQLVVYRIAQEALTNTIQHAGPARAQVHLEYATSELLLSVCDDGRGASTQPRAQPGHGLAGMRERVALYDGKISIGPQAGGGFRVAAALPIAEWVTLGPA